MKNNQHPYLIRTFGGFLGEQRLFLKGRILENENFEAEPTDSRWRNLLDSFRRFESDEVEGAKVRVNFENFTWELETDSEGYFELDVPFKYDYSKYKSELPAQVTLLFPTYEDELNATALIFIPHREANFGVISDMDDTVLQTHATSRLRLRMMYVSFMQGAHQRMPMEGIVELFQGLWGTDSIKPPFFYVSNGPWNIYDLLAQFLDIQKLPAGPIMLRDYGLHLLSRKNSMAHKMESIQRILESYPKLSFVLLGDTASKDADHYLHFKNQYPDQIKAVYIRLTRNTKNAMRVAELIEGIDDPNFLLIKESKEIHAHALKIGLINDADAV